jgi:GNAT superfamily N-acetyltransferase
VEGFLTRAYEPADAQAVADLFNIIDEHGGGHAGYVPGDVQAIVDHMVATPEADTRLVFAPDGQLVGVAFTSTPPDGGYRIDLGGGVHPRWRGRGIGRELFDHQLARCAAIHAERGAGERWEMHAGVMIGDEDSQRLYRHAGFTPVRYWFEMVAPTADAPAPVLPEGLRVTSYSPEYEKATYDAHTEAFADHFGFQRRGLPEWCGLTVRSDTFLPDLSVLAWSGEEIVGYVLSYRDPNEKWLYVGHVGTRRAWRRRGLATGLLAHVLRDASRAGMTTATLGVDADSPTGAVGVYERVGFAIDSRAVTYVGTLPR